MIRTIILAASFVVFAVISASPAMARNYAQVICDNEPDPVLCKKIQDWYQAARQPKPASVSCCGEADAYWADQVDRVTKNGAFVTITDKRDCPPPGQGPTYEDEDGNLVPYQTPVQPTDCISSRRPRDGEHIFVPNEKLDNRFQGNPTGHNVIFIALNPYTITEEGVGYPSILCAFLEFPG